MREAKDTFGVARALSGLGVIARLEDDLAGAHSLLEQGAAMYRICGHRKGIAWCYYERGKVAWRQGNQDLRLTLFQEGRAISRLLGDGEGIGFACFNIGAVFQQRGEYSQAESAGMEALRAAQRSGLALREIMNILWLGDLACDQNDFERGERYYQAAVQRDAQAQFPEGTYIALERLAGLAFLRQGREQAVCLLACAESLGVSEPLEMPNEPRFVTQDLRRDLREAFQSSAFEAACARGQMLSPEQVCALAFGAA